MTHTAEELHARMDARGWRESRGCWLYGKEPWMYGSVCGRPAHRVAYERWNGPIPAGHVVRHTCDTPACINPKHLLTGTHRDNWDDCVARKRHLNFMGSERHRDTSAQRVSPDDAAQMRRMLESGTTATVVARVFHVSREFVRLLAPDIVPETDPPTVPERWEEQVRDRLAAGDTPSAIAADLGLPKRIVRAMRPDDYVWNRR